MIIFENPNLTDMSYNCLIIDDYELDRLMTISYVKRFPELNIGGVFASATEAIAALEQNNIDVLFLDIDMPEMNGLEFRKLAFDVPACIFITAHPEHALEGYEANALDFLIKPVKFERFEASVQRLKDYLDLRQKASLFETTVGGDAIYIKEGRETVKIRMHDILYLEALRDYTCIVTSQKKHYVLNTLGALLQESDFSSFVRIHRSYAVQKQFIQKINIHEVQLHNGAVIPVGRSYKKSTKQLI